MVSNNYVLLITCLIMWSRQGCCNLNGEAKLDSDSSKTTSISIPSNITSTSIPSNITSTSTPQTPNATTEHYANTTMSNTTTSGTTMEMTTGSMTTETPFPELKTLVQIHVIFRHGDRSPISLIPNDKHSKDQWLEGLGQLTKTGEKQLFLVGQKLRQDYLEASPDLPADYVKENRKKIQVRSSEQTRCLMSALSLLYGMYPANNESAGLPVEPVPTNTKPIAEDYLIEGTEACGLYGKEREAIMQSDEVKKIEEANKDMFTKLASMTGWKTFNLSMAWDLADILWCQEQHKERNFTKDTKYQNYTQKLYKIRNNQWNVLFNTSDHLNQAKFIAGGLLQEVVNNMKKITNSTTTKDTPAVVLYSGHDTNLAALLHVLNYTLGNVSDPIPYGSYLAFELWHPVNGTQSKVTITFTHMVNMMNSTTWKKVKIIDLKPLGSFVNDTMPVTFKDEDDVISQCSQTSSFSLSRDQIIAIVLGVVLLLVIVVAVACFFVRRRRGDGGYTMQVNE